MQSPSQALQHILLIDAEAYAWSVVRHALGEDCRVSTVAFRSTALRILNKDPPDLIVVDFGPSALGLLLAIYGLRREVAVVMATSDYKLARRLMRLGCDVVRKPYSPPELRACVAKALADSSDNLRRHRAALKQIQTDRHERDAVLQLLPAVMRGHVLRTLEWTRP